MIDGRRSYFVDAGLIRLGDRYRFTAVDSDSNRSPVERIARDWLRSARQKNGKKKQTKQNTKAPRSDVDERRLEAGRVGQLRQGVADGDQCDDGVLVDRIHTADDEQQRRRNESACQHQTPSCGTWIETR